MGTKPKTLMAESAELLKALKPMNAQIDKNIKRAVPTAGDYAGGPAGRGGSEGGKSLGKHYLCDPARIVDLIPLEVVRYLQQYGDPRVHDRCIDILDKKIGIDTVCMLIAEGALLPQISKTLKVPHHLLNKWIRSTADYREKFEAAKACAAHAYAYLALKVVQDCPPIREDLTQAKLLAAHYTWLAKTYAPETYTTDTQRAASGGEGDEFNVCINIGEVPSGGGVGDGGKGGGEVIDI